MSHKKKLVAAKVFVNTNGQYNIAVGNTIGYNNTIIGITSGAYNTAIGITIGN